jgi:DNA-binding transcriptional regulator YhcF (GntR family)
MKITKRKLKSIIREEAQLAGSLQDVAAAQEEIENILNALYDTGVDNEGLKALLNNIITDVERGFIGEPS